MEWGQHLLLIYRFQEKLLSKTEVRDLPKGQLKHQLIPRRTPDLPRAVAGQKVEKRRSALVGKQEVEITEEIPDVMGKGHFILHFLTLALLRKS